MIVSSTQPKVIIQLSNSGHYPDLFVEGTKEDLEEINRVEGKGYLSDTEAGRELLKRLEALPQVEVHTVIRYI